MPNSASSMVADYGSKWVNILAKIMDTVSGRNRNAPAPAWRWARNGLLVLVLILIGFAGYFQVEGANQISGWLGIIAVLASLLLISVTIHLFLWSLDIQPRFNRLVLIFAFLICSGIGLPVWGIPGALIPALVLVFLVSITFGALASLRSNGYSNSNILAVPALALGIVGLGGGIFMAVQPIPNPNPWLDQVVRQDRTLNLPDPGQPGKYEVEAFTYGSGEDKHRAEFASEARYVTPSVDGSIMVSGWDGVVGRTRTEFWGFDHKALPVQAYVWAPKGSGPFPLVLMVHGGHPMEDFSELGYAYLGKHFASQGMIAVSVDQNFLNPSVSGLRNPLVGGIGPENDARGWMLLKHLEQWRTWTNDVDHPLFGKADMERIALLGHSRGGEAVTIAANFNSLKYYPDNASEQFDFGFDLKALIAVGTIDGQYNPRGKSKTLTDISYFTIEGSMDSDMESFMGSSQMSRVQLSGRTNAIKASLYVEGANHGQFNTVWGWADRGLPFSWLLNRGGFMSGADQRQIAKVYFSAFLDSTLNDNAKYWPMLGDPQKAAAWLPKNHMLANLITSKRQVIADFEGDMDLSRETATGTAIAATNLTKWREEWIRLKWLPLDTHAVILSWDDSVKPETASYELAWEPQSLTLSEESLLVFAASDANEGTKPTGWTPRNGRVTAPLPEAETVAGLDWTIVISDTSGNEAALPLSYDSRLYPQIASSKRIFEGLASIAKSEVVWRRFEFPISAFLMMNPDLNIDTLGSVRFEFNKSGAGSVVLDEIGFE
jgi:hypothetical protein